MQLILFTKDQDDDEYQQEYNSLVDTDSALIPKCVLP